MSTPHGNFKGEKPYFIGIDSDGCVFDTMEVKHKRCFAPVFIDFFGLRPVAQCAGETWNFVNLYSRKRGTNRFQALADTLDLLPRRDEVKKAGISIAPFHDFRKWLKNENCLGNPALIEAIEKTGSRELRMILDWSLEVTRHIEEKAAQVPPFPFVQQSLEVIAGRADAVVLSQSACAILEREWAAYNLTPYIRYIAGQETGKKQDHLARAAESGFYDRDCLLMIGDAPGDLRAARQTGALFFPILPGREGDSWDRFYREGLDRFLKGSFKGDYEWALEQEFLSILPENPPW